MSITQEQASIVGKYLWTNDDVPTVKIAVMGEGDVGKRSILQKFCFGFLSGVDDSVTATGFGLQRPVTIQGKDINVRFDLIAEEQELPPNEACMLVYDVTSNDSFQALDRLRAGFASRRLIPRRQARRTTFFVIANKIDRWRGDWAVSLREADDFSESIDARFLQTSALTGKGLGDEVFVDIVCRILLARIHDEAGPRFMTRPVPIEEDAMTLQVFRALVSSWLLLTAWRCSDSSDRCEPMSTIRRVVKLLKRKVLSQGSKVLNSDGRSSSLSFSFGVEPLKSRRLQKAC